MIINLRKITKSDLNVYTYWLQSFHEYHKLNGPYFKKATITEIDQKVSEIRNELENGNSDPLPQKRMISNPEGEILGEVSWYWKSKETNWIELGIIIFNKEQWGKGIGKKALKLWIDELFESKPEIARLGLTTWSGNKGMIRLAISLGMQQEARYRKARIVDGEYFDSVSYGILREEWENHYF